MLIIGAIFILSLQSEYCNSEKIDISNLMTNNQNITIGQSCKRDNQCIKNAYCRSQNTCWCDETYKHDPTMLVCHATAGTNCASHDDCKTMSNAECVQNSCVCMNNYFLDINNSSDCIIRPRKLGDRCQRDDECIEVLIKAHCVRDKCRCNGDYKFANETGNCIQARGIYQPCVHDYECYDEYRPNDLHCRDGECAYKHLETGGCKLELPIHPMILGFSSVFLFMLTS